MENKEVVSELKEVNEFVNDGAKGYRRAADRTKNEHLKKVFSKYAEERDRFSNEINDLIIQYGGEPETSGTIKGGFFRQWMNIKDTFTGEDDENLIKSSRYGEEWAQKAYNKALEEDLPQNVRQTLNKQLKASENAYNELEKMKEKVH